MGYYQAGFKTPEVEGVLPLGSIDDSEISDTANITATKIPGLSTLPTQTVTNVAVSGGVFNGDFENAPAFTAATGANNWIDGTAAGSASNDSYGYFVSHITSFQAVQFDNTVARSGLTSMKISSTDANGKAWVGIRSSAPSRYATVAEIKKYLIPIKANTVYKMNIWCKTINAAAASAFFSITEYSDTTNVAAGDSNTLTGTNDWTLLTRTWTTNASATYMEFNMKMAVAGSGQIIYFDDVRLMEVQSPTTSVTVPTPVSIAAQAVTSTNRIDQSSTTVDSNDSLGRASVNDYLAQPFTPTRKYCSGVAFQRAADGGTGGSGTVTVSIRTDSAGSPSATILASYQYTNAAFKALSLNTDYTVPVPSTLTPGTQYWIVFYTDATDASNYFRINSKATGGGKYQLAAGGWGALNKDLYYKEFYARSTEDMKITVNGVSTLLKADGDGILSGSVLDVDNGRYKYGLSADFIQFPDTTIANDVYSSTVGSSTAAMQVLNGWTYTVATGDIRSASDTTARNLTFKVNTLLPVKNLTIRTKLYYTANSIQVSSDNVNWITLSTTTASAYVNVTNTTFAMNGLSVFYVRLSKDTTNTACLLNSLSIEADVDTSSLSVGMVYPLGINQFSESYDLPSTATRLYFNLAKYTNTNGVVMPAFAYSDSSGNLIGYPIFCPIDNSGEVNPAVNVLLASTTNAQASGTGSANGTTGYILNDGEYMTLTGATGMGTLTYQMGTGTTTFGNITKNLVLVSSNGSAIATDRDPSLQCNIQYGIRIQGEIENTNLIESEINALQTKLANAENTGRITVGTGTTTVIENYGYTDLIIGVPSTALAVGVDLGSVLLRKVKSVTITDESGACGTNNITISTQGTELINGAATFVMNTNYQSVTLYNNGINWFIS